MARIALYCDGTWNRSDSTDPTNVVRLAQLTPTRGADGDHQLVHYMPGVGTGRGSSGIARHVDRLAGGALGWGLTENIEEAYRLLAFGHAPGDSIYLFGFSRGAFTARSLAGLIRAAGLPARSQVHRIPEAIARYRSRDPETHPEHEDSFAWRAKFSPDLATSAGEAAWRAERGLPTAQVDIAYLGVWDTVGALGIPRHLPLAHWLNRRHLFHDTALSRSVRAARHAVAIDERRITFPPTLWTNLDTLSEGREGTPYGQHWFPGDHGAVGGGGPRRGLSSAALLWVAEGAAAAGLTFDDALSGIEDLVDPFAPLSAQAETSRGAVDTLLQLRARDRDGPVHIDTVSDIALRRWRGDDRLPAPYRPAPLMRLAADLDAPATGGD